ncbi:MAG: hypothetical protein IPI58_09840 [Alphaproteobacteria bacterium]|nr:MAG: hypothetical protein IPI58_09840 [Alphaproteobacteria bacterium]
MTTNAAADSILDRLDTAIKNKTPDWRGLAQEFCDGEWGESEKYIKDMSNRYDNTFVAPKWMTSGDQRRDGQEAYGSNWVTGLPDGGAIVWGNIPPNGCKLFIVGLEDVMHVGRLAYATNGYPL